MTPESLLEEFRTRLGRTQLPSQVELFQGDLFRCNLNIMAAALMEVRAVTSRTGVVPSDARSTVLNTYAVKVAEISQLFPLFFVFESAFRSFAAARLRLIYGEELWWEPIRNALLNSRPLAAVHRLGRCGARRDVKDTVAHLLRGMGPGVMAIRTTYDLLEGGTLAHVERLIDQHWTDMSQVFHTAPGATRLRSSAFRERFSVVRNARNDAYHHRTVAGRPRMVAFAEQLLDLIDINLAARMHEVAAARLPPLPFSLALEDRHG
jgi:hypothetical protein